MADNVAITAGAGTTIATDDITSVHYQRVKLVDGTLDSTTAVGVAGNGTAASAIRVTVANDSTGIVALTTSTASIGKLAANSGVDIGDVDVTSIAAGTNYIGKVRLTDGTNDASVSTSGGLFVGGAVAHDAADSGNPLKLGAKASTALSGLTLVANADRTDLFAGVDGALIVRPHCNLEDIVSARISDTAGNAVDIIAAQTAGVRTYLTGITLVNTSANNVYADILDGATIAWTVPLPAYGGATINFTVPLKGSAATAWRLDVSAATTTVYASAVGFKSKV